MPLVSALLVAAVSLEHLPMGGGLELVYCGLTKSSAALLGDDLAVLRSIQGNFQPIRAHFESARNSSGIAGFSFRKFESITIQLLQRRLLLDTAGFMECTSPGHPVKQPDPDLVDLVICTRDRPEALHRNIETCLQSSEMWGRQVNFLIIDDSHTEAGNRATETVLSAFTTGTAKPNFV